jgi:hypothetical protein
MKKSSKLTVLLLSSLCLPILMGCRSTYYSVSEPASGKTYYTTKLEKYKKTGAISFVDVVSGKQVTLQTSELKSLSRQEFNRRLYEKK